MRRGKRSPGYRRIGRSPALDSPGASVSPCPSKSLTTGLDRAPVSQGVGRPGNPTDFNLAGPPLTRYRPAGGSGDSGCFQEPAQLSGSQQGGTIFSCARESRSCWRPSGSGRLGFGGTKSVIALLTPAVGSLLIVVDRITGWKRGSGLASYSTTSCCPP